MSSTIQDPSEQFVDRRATSQSGTSARDERRQFTGSYEDLSDQGRELGLAVDQYKMQHRRRFVTYDEIIGVIKTLGYSK